MVSGDSMDCGGEEMTSVNRLPNDNTSDQLIKNIREINSNYHQRPQVFH